MICGLVFTAYTFRLCTVWGTVQKRMGGIENGSCRFSIRLIATPLFSSKV